MEANSLEKLRQNYPRKDDSKDVNFLDHNWTEWMGEKTLVGICMCKTILDIVHLHISLLLHTSGADRVVSHHPPTAGGAFDALS